MNMHEKSPEDRAKVTYGRLKIPYKSAQCAARVFAMYNASQCQRKPGHGAGRLYCRQHAKQYPDLEKSVPVSGFVVDNYSRPTIKPFSGTRTEDGIVRNANGFRVDVFIFPSWREAHDSIVASAQSKFEAAIRAADRAEAEYKAALAMEEPKDGA